MRGTKGSSSSSQPQKSLTLSRKISLRLSTWIDKSQIPPGIILIGTALLVGISTGYGAVAFRYLIEFVGFVGFQWVPQNFANIGLLYIILIPALGGLLVGLLVYFFASEAKGHGVPEVMEAIALKGGRIRPAIGFIKAIASSFSIGSGGSVGREGPIVQIGSAIGSTAGQFLRLSDNRVRNLVACGAAGGIAATFNAPIAGVIFALEIILGEFSTRYFSTVVISSVSASVIGRSVFGNEPAFSIPMEYGINSSIEFAFYPILGICAAFVGVGFIKLLYWTEDLFDSIKNFPEWAKPALGGMLLGIMGLTYPYFTGVSWEGTPHIFNVGYHVIESTLRNEMTLYIVVILLGLKMIATSLTLGSGGSGGVFAPGLFIGAMLGAAFELSITEIFPDLLAPTGAYALVGMGAVFAATAHAPITAVIILFELTGDYRIILPLMLTVVIATLLSQKLLKQESIYTLKLTRRGIRLQKGKDVDVLEGISVNQVMQKQVDTVTPDMNLKQLSEEFKRSRHHGMPIVDKKGKLKGIVTVSDLDSAFEKNMDKDTSVIEIGTPLSDLLFVNPHESMGNALNKMSTRGLGRLPVVADDNPSQLLGLIRRADIIKAHNIALSKRNENQQDRKTLEEEMDIIQANEFITIQLEEGDASVGKTLQEISESLPEECIIISIRNNGKSTIPHGNTILKPGDSITAFISSREEEKVRSCFK